MRPLTILAILISLLGNTFTGYSQSKFESDDPLNKLLSTQFMEKFMEMRVAAESSVRSFKGQQENYAPRDIAKIQVAYDRTAEQFNFVLRGIKEDLLDKKKLKYIERYPDDYAKELELDMYKLSDFYANNYQQVLADITANQVDGSAVLALIAGILDVSFNIYGLVKNIGMSVSKNKARKEYFNEQRLERVLMKPYLWIKWNEMDQQNSMYETPDNTAQNISTLYQDQEATFNSQIPNSTESYAEKRLRELQAKKNLEKLKNGEPIDEPFFDPNQDESIFIPESNFQGEGLDANGNPLPPDSGGIQPQEQGPEPSTGKVIPSNKDGAINIAIPKKKVKKEKIKN